MRLDTEVTLFKINKAEFDLGSTYGFKESNVKLGTYLCNFSISEINPLKREAGEFLQIDAIARFNGFVDVSDATHALIKGVTYRINYAYMFSTNKTALKLRSDDDVE